MKVEYDMLNPQEFNDFVPEVTRRKQKINMQRVLFVCAAFVGVLFIYDMITAENNSSSQED